MFLFVAALLLSPIEARAGAAGAHPSPQASAVSSAAFVVHGSNGFSLDVESERGMVTILAADRRPPVATFAPTGELLPANRGNVASSTYVAFGAGPDPHEVDVPLGGLGRISVTFRPSGKVRVTELQPGPARGCVGPSRLVRRLGSFSGTIEFRGEHGYTEVHARRAKGSVGTPLEGACLEADAQGPSPRLPTPAGSAVLTALSNRAGVQFEAVTTDAQVRYTASAVSSLGLSTVVLRSAQAVAPKHSFAFDEALRSATIAPPPPFAGKADFASGQGRTWAGDLRVDFPGASTLLTGPDYRATLGY